MKHRIINCFILCVILILLTSLSSCGFDSDDISNQAKSIVQADNEYVLGVKGGYPESYPDITYEEAFESFFSNPTWTYFEGSREDDEKTYNVVEFTGNCLYADKEVKALIQFTISDDEKSFEATYFSLNDIPQTNADLYGLIEKVFTEYQESQDMESNKAVPNN